jgi:multidrug resistance efflux pump
VEAGQRIAIVESASMLRTLSELSVEKAKLNTRMAEIEARLAATQKLIPEAEANSQQIKLYLDKLREAHSKGTVVDKTLTDMMNASLQASERLSSLKAERQSLEAEAASYREAAANVSELYRSLSKTYADGVLTTPASGYIGSKVMTSGSVVAANGGSIATVYTGAPYILAYLPDSYLLNIDVGEGVKVRSYAKSVVGTVQDILPVTDAVPPEFQVPTAVRERGRLVKIAIPEAGRFSLDQKVKVSACVVSSCTPDDASSTVAGAAYHQNTFAYTALFVLSETTKAIVNIVTTLVGWALKSL